MAKVILEFFWKPFVLREEEFEDTVHLIFDLDVSSYFQSQETVLHNLRPQKNLDVFFYFLSRGEKHDCMEAMFCRGATDFIDSFCLNPPAEEIFLQESATWTPASHFHWMHKEITGKTAP